MNTSPSAPAHKGPHLGLLAVLYTFLFCLGLYPVTALYKQPYWPGPWEPASVIIPYFQNYGGRVLFCIVLQLGAMVCLGTFTATVVSRLHFLGARAAGTYIALAGGFLVVADAFAGTMAMWTMLQPEILHEPALVVALYYLGFGFGGPGFSVPMGLADGRCFHNRSIYALATQMGDRARPGPGRGRRDQLAAPSFSAASVFDSARPFSRICVADCGWISSSENTRNSCGEFSGSCLNACGIFRHFRCVTARRPMDDSHLAALLTTAEESIAAVGLES